MIFAFQYQTATYAPGETEQLDPVKIVSCCRSEANDAFLLYVSKFGGRVVHCDSCCAPLLVGETDCAECVELDKKEG